MTGRSSMGDSAWQWWDESRHGNESMLDDNSVKRRMTDERCEHGTSCMSEVHRRVGSRRAEALPGGKASQGRNVRDLSLSASSGGLRFGVVFGVFCWDNAEYTSLGAFRM